jgi:mannitol-specific phosphotransferase system IIBC component
MSVNFLDGQDLEALFEECPELIWNSDFGSDNQFITEEIDGTSTIASVIVVIIIVVIIATIIHKKKKKKQEKEKKKKDSSDSDKKSKKKSDNAVQTQNMMLKLIPNVTVYM